MSIDDSFNKQKKKHLKIIYKLQLNDENEYQDRRGVSKTLKMDENNQYNQTMIKSLPTCCI